MECSLAGTLWVFLAFLIGSALATGEFVRSHKISYITILRWGPGLMRERLGHLKFSQRTQDI